MASVYELMECYNRHLLCRLGISFTQDNGSFSFDIEPEWPSTFYRIRCKLFYCLESMCLIAEYPIRAIFETEQQQDELSQFLSDIAPFTGSGGFELRGSQILYCLEYDCSKCLPSEAALLACIHSCEEELNRWHGPLQDLLRGVSADIVEVNLPQEMLQTDCPEIVPDIVDEETRPGFENRIFQFRFQMASRMDDLNHAHRQLFRAFDKVHCIFVLLGFLVSSIICAASVTQQLLELYSIHWHFPSAVSDCLISILSTIHWPLSGLLLAWGICSIRYVVQSLAFVWKDFYDEEDADDPEYASNRLKVESMIFILKLCFIFFCGAVALHLVLLVQFEPLLYVGLALLDFAGLFYLSMWLLSELFQEPDKTLWAWFFLGTTLFAVALGIAILPILG